MHLVGPLLGLIDAGVVGRAPGGGAVALAALSPGTVVVDYSCYLATALAVAATNSLALRFARRDGPGAAAALGDALSTAALAGVALGAFQWFAGPPLAAALFSGSPSPAGATAAVAGAAALYIRARALAAPAALVGFIAQAYFLAARSPGPPLVAALISGVVNLAGDWLLCVRPFNTGIAGAGAATFLAVAAGTAALLVALGRPLKGAAARAALPSPAFTPGPLAPMARLPSGASLAATARLAGPVAALLAVKVAFYAALAAAAAAVGGPTGSAAHHVAITAFILFATAGDAVGAAAQAWLPGAVGDPASASSVSSRLLAVGAGVGALNCAAAVAGLAAAAPLFSPDPAVAGALVALAPAAGGCLALHAASMATEGMLLAGRDLTFLGATNALNVGVALAALAARTAAPGAGLGGVWLTLAQFQGTRLAFNSWRLWVSRGSPLRATVGLPLGGGGGGEGGVVAAAAAAG